MCYSNWRDIFNNMFISLDFPDRYTAIRCTHEWNTSEKNNSGGTPISTKGDEILNWAKNP